MIYSDVLKGGSSGKCVESGDADSLLVKCITHEEEPIMPPKGPKLEDAEIDLIRKWVAGGLLENSKSKRIKKASNDIAMTMPAILKGQVILPKHLSIKPFIVTKKANAITAMAQSPYSPLLAVGGYKQVLLYNTDTMTLSGILPFDEGQIYDVKFSRDGSIIMAAGGINGKSGNVVLWNVKSGKRLTALSPDFDTTLTADISSDRKYLVTGSSDKLVKIFSLQTGEVLHNIKQHSEWITNVSVSPDGVLVASGDRNGHIYVWEIESGQKLYTMMQHKQAITALTWRADSNLLASSSEDGEIVVWNIYNGRQSKRFKAHNGGVTDLFYSSKGELVSTGRDRYTRLYDAKYKQTKNTKTNSLLPLKVIADSDVQNILYADWQGKVHRWNLKANKVDRTLEANPKNITNAIQSFQQDIENLNNEIASDKKELAKLQNTINSFDTYRKLPSKIKADINSNQKNLNAKQQELGKIKDTKLKANLTKVVDGLKKDVADLKKKLKATEDDIRKRGKHIADTKKKISSVAKLIKAKELDTKALQLSIQRYHAEKINATRHELISKLETLQLDVDSAKYVEEDIKLQMSSNNSEREKLIKLADAIEKEMTEDEALDLLIERHDKIISLAKRNEELLTETTKNAQELPGKKKTLEELKKKEKELYKEYLSQLPKELSIEQVKK